MRDESVSTPDAATIMTVRRFGISESSVAYLAGWAGTAGGGAPPVPNVWPLGRTTLLRRPTGAPLFTGCKVTVTASPALNEVRAQPSLVMSVGLLTSTAQFRTAPVSSLASNFRKQWGL